ncbi:hypothetical protein [Natrinema sp. CGMCC1.2065]|uniref:hypothetical protein n=1 Tax=Natrinema sp. CGMCC1.2065 TaxID=3445767 RepID=UPI003F49F3AF
MPCGYCDLSGHSIDVCPERLEEYHGLPSDNCEDEDEEQEKEIATDGGLWDCPDCGRSVHPLVNPLRCPRCQTENPNAGGCA